MHIRLRCWKICACLSRFIVDSGELNRITLCAKVLLFAFCFIYTYVLAISGVYIIGIREDKAATTAKHQQDSYRQGKCIGKDFFCQRERESREALERCGWLSLRLPSNRRDDHQSRRNPAVRARHFPIYPEQSPRLRSLLSSLSSSNEREIQPEFVILVICRHLMMLYVGY